MAGDPESLEGNRFQSSTSAATHTLLNPSETDLDLSLRRLEVFLSFLGFHSHSSILKLLLCASAFLFLGVAVPISTIILTLCPHGGCDGYWIERFEVTVLVFRVLLAAVSLACVSHNLYKYGIRRFLFVDQQHGQADRFQKEYVRKIQV